MDKGEKPVLDIVDSPLSGTSREEAPGRLRWRSRRGMLELDLVLERFLGEIYPTLTAPQQAEFEQLLDLPDQELWHVVREDGTDASVVVKLLRECRY